MDTDIRIERRVSWNIILDNFHSNFSNFLNVLDYEPLFHWLAVRCAHFAEKQFLKYDFLPYSL